MKLSIFSDRYTAKETADILGIREETLAFGVIKIQRQEKHGKVSSRSGLMYKVFSI